MTGDELIAKYAVPDRIPEPANWPMSDPGLREQNARLVYAIAELKCQRNDLIADVHRAEEAAGRTYRAEAAAARYRRYFVWSFGALMVAAMAGIGWAIWQA
jgi:hypothetical protein